MKIEISLFILLGMIPILSERMAVSVLQPMKEKVLSVKNKDVDRISDSFVYTPDSRPFGKSYKEWIQLSWETLYSLECMDFVGFYQLIELDENVTLFMSEMEDTELTISIPKNKAIMLRMGAVAYTYPCPEISFKPGLGQSLEKFLHSKVDTVINMMHINEVSLDGNEISTIQDFRFVSNLFNITGDTELASCFDSCITGEPQPCVTGGYYIILKKMSSGNHTLKRGGEIPSIGLKWNQTIHLIVE